MRHPTPRRSWILTWPILLTLPLAILTALLLALTSNQECNDEY